MLGLVLAALAMSWFGRQHTRKELTYSEFVEILKSGKTINGTTLNAENIYELRISHGYVTFQDHDKKPNGDAPSEANYYQVPVEKIWEVDQAKLSQLLEEKGIKFGLGSPASPWTELFIYTSFLILLFVFLLMLLRRIGGPGAAMSFSRSRGKLFAQEDVKITFADVAGIDEAVEELKEVVEFLRTPQKYQALGGRIPRGPYPASPVDPA